MDTKFWEQQYENEATVTFRQHPRQKLLHKLFSPNDHYLNFKKDGDGGVEIPVEIAVKCTLRYYPETGHEAAYLYLGDGNGDIAVSDDVLKHVTYRWIMTSKATT